MVGTFDYMIQCRDFGVRFSPSLSFLIGWWNYIPSHWMLNWPVIQNHWLWCVRFVKLLNWNGTTICWTVVADSSKFSTFHLTSFRFSFTTESQSKPYFFTCCFLRLGNGTMAPWKIFGRPFKWRWLNMKRDVY